MTQEGREAEGFISGKFKGFEREHEEDGQKGDWEKEKKLLPILVTDDSERINI